MSMKRSPAPLARCAGSKVETQGTLLRPAPSSVSWPRLGGCCFQLVNRRSSAALLVGFLLFDLTAVLVELLIQIDTLIFGEHAIRLVVALQVANVASLPSQLLCFAPRQLA